MHRRIIRTTLHHEDTKITKIDLYKRGFVSFVIS
jgi:hypothetical protein